MSDPDLIPIDTPEPGWQRAARAYHAASSVVCPRCRSLLEEVRLLNAQLAEQAEALAKSERDLAAARRVAESLASRCASQSDLLTARAERPADAAPAGLGLAQIDLDTE